MEQFPNNQTAGGAMQGFGAVERSEGFSFLEPGIHTVTIVDITVERPATKKPFIQVEFKSDRGGTKQKFYISPNALEQTMINLVHLFNKVTTDEELNKLSWPDGQYEQMVAQIKPLVCTGAALQIKLIGEESEYNGKITVWPKFGFRPFAQKMGDDNLFFNADTDIKRVEQPNLTSNVQAPTAGGSAVPQTPGEAPGAAPAAPIDVPQ